MGHTGYYHRFIRSYTSITTPLEKLLKKSKVFHWTPECDRDFNILKEKLSSSPILTYPNWQVEFHVHIDASCTALGVFVAQPSEGNLYHPIYSTNIKLLHDECNYTTTEREGLVMVYALQKLDTIC
jgi:hypothetical protein